MRSRKLLPCAPSRSFVRLYWLLEIEEPAAFGPPECGTPDGLLEVVFHYREPMLCRFENEPFTPQPQSAAVS